MTDDASLETTVTYLEPRAPDERAEKEEKCKNKFSYYDTTTSTNKKLLVVVVGRGGFLGAGVLELKNDLKSKSIEIPKNFDLDFLTLVRQKCGHPKCVHTFRAPKLSSARLSR